jgi:glycine/serine hydroxymethyltransferase
MKGSEQISSVERSAAFGRDHTIRAVDPKLWEAIEGEHRRQHDHIELIASEKGRKDRK